MPSSSFGNPLRLRRLSCAFAGRRRFSRSSLGNLLRLRWRSRAPWALRLPSGSTLIGNSSRYPLPSALLLGCLGLLLSTGSVSAQEGSIVGQLFTAEHPDSVAAGAQLTLIYRTPAGEVERVPASAGPHGEYEFQGLSADPSIQYVIKVSHFGRDFLGAPIQFESGQTTLAYNFLVARDAAPLPAGGMEGHPPISSDTPAQMAPPTVRQNPVTMTVIVLTILALFGLPITTAYRRDRVSSESGREDPEAAALIRDIASLDLRFSRQELESTDYEAVRRSLLRRLHELTGVGERSA